MYWSLIQHTFIPWLQTPLCTSHLFSIHSSLGYKHLYALVIYSAYTHPLVTNTNTNTWCIPCTCVSKQHALSEAFPFNQYKVRSVKMMMIMMMTMTMMMMMMMMMMIQTCTVPPTSVLKHTHAHMYTHTLAHNKYTDTD